MIANGVYDEKVSAEEDVGPSDQDPHLPGAVLNEKAQLRIPSRTEWIGPTVDFLCDRAARCGACSTDRAAKLTLALHEALTNSVVHGNLELSSELKEQGDSAFAEALAARTADPILSGRSVDIQTEYDGEAYRWVLTDEGKGFDVARAMARAASDDPEVMLASGRGLILMQALLDDVRYEMGGRRVELTVRRGAAEKRKFERRPLQENVRVAPIHADGTVDWDAAYHALSRDLSEGGISLLQTRLETSTRVLIGMDWEGEVLYVPAEIRHCETLGEGMVQLGCRFQTGEGPPPRPAESASSEDVGIAIDNLLDRLSGAVLEPHERRVHQRVVYTEKIGVSGGPGPSIAFARNLSKGGISLLAHLPLPQESRVLSLPRPGGAPLRLRAQIVRCTPLMDGVFEVGARFEEMA